MSASSQKAHRIMYLAGLMFAGEIIYALPFHITRFFRPTVLEVFSFTNTELGAVLGVYGIVAMLSYFPGGPLADRFPARKLLAFSLWSTAAGGLYMATLPDYRGALILWGFLGLTTILLFWASLIRATRDWGGHDAQGRAYGLLDGGRGLIAAGIGSIAVASFGYFFPEGYASASPGDKRLGLSAIIYGYSGVTAVAGIVVWFVISDPHTTETSQRRYEPDKESAWIHIKCVMRIPAIWLQSLIVMCAYVGYKGLDNYSLFAVQVYGMNAVDAAGLVAIGAWLRPVAAVTAGYLGDRYTISRMTLISFILLLAAQLFLALDTPDHGAVWVLVCNLLLTSTAVFGLRGLYFALFEEASVPTTVTGTAVGLVSVLGYTPDIFVNFAGGMILDQSPGLAGHQHFYLFLAAFSVIGLIASFTLTRILHRPA
jgi:MFS transporter, GlpU family, inner membrane protein